MSRRSRTPYVLLGLLATESMSGYDLKAAVGRTVGHFWSESYGQLYPTLRRLEEEGALVSRQEDGGRRARVVYSITPQGREMLANWLDRTPAPALPRNELLLKLFFGFFAPPERTRRLLEEGLARFQTEAARLAHIEREVREQTPDAPERLYWLLTIDLGRRLADAKIAWARAALRRLPE
ncbi:MAG: PadR family transcriptional regulator [Myxococcota bacterium]